MDSEKKILQFAVLYLEYAYVNLEPLELTGLIVKLCACTISGKLCKVVEKCVNQLVACMISASPQFSLQLHLLGSQLQLSWCHSSP